MTRLVLPDVHFPFHDKKLVSAWLSHLSDLKPDGIDILGDLLDCYTLSRFDKNPARKFSLQDEIELAKDFLGTVRCLAGRDCDIRYSEGNHEDRLRKIVWKRIPELADQVPDVAEQLDLKKLGISWHSTQNPYQIRGLWYCHGDLLRMHAGMSARAKAEQIHGAVMIGHTHRQGWSPKSTWGGDQDGYEAGYLADYRQLDYVRSYPNWQRGWAVVEFPEEGGHDVSFVKVRTIGRRDRIIYKGQVVS
jgi:hypothetical protein